MPEHFAVWFASRGWNPRPHQLAVLDAAAAGRHALLIAPTGGGKTLAGFLPSLIDLYRAPRAGLHTLYVSPLKALAADIARNLQVPVQEMALAVTIATRSGDTGTGARRKQRESPPNLLLTTPESLALLIAQPDAAAFFASLAVVVIDEIHALAGTKRGDQLGLCLSRLTHLAPSHRRIGLSATVAHRLPLQAFVSTDGRGGGVEIIETAGGAAPDIGMILPGGRLPWSGHMGLFSAPEVLARIHGAGMTIVFVNTRAQSELMFQELWRLNADTLPIAIHHGSLEPEQRRRVEAAMAAGSLRAVVATSSLDLGIDWGGVDQVIQIGAPKGVSRLLQRVGRANHRMDEASIAMLVPANRFEVLECEAAILGAAALELDGDPPAPGGLDVLAQHLLGCACAAPFHPDAMYDEVRGAGPYAGLTRRDFDDVLRFVEDGGYALSAYDRYRKLFRDSEGRVHVRSERIARQHRMNIGTIVEAPTMKVRYFGRGGGNIGEVEESFVTTLVAGDTFMFAGRLLRFLRLRETVVEVADGGTGEPKVPTWAGGRMPMTTNLANRVRAMLQAPETWHLFPEPVREWLALQKARSRLPGRDDLLVETFPRGDRWYLVAYCFEGRQAHQTLGLLLTRRMERAEMMPLGFVATDYVLAVWSANQPVDVAPLFEQGHAGRRRRGLDGGELGPAPHLPPGGSDRRPDRAAGAGGEQEPAAGDGEQRPDLRRAAAPPAPTTSCCAPPAPNAAGGLTDLGRIAGMLDRVRGRITHMALSRVSPLAVPVLLEVGRESVRHAGGDNLLLEEASLVAEAMSEP